MTSGRIGFLDTAQGLYASTHQIGLPCFAGGGGGGGGERGASLVIKVRFRLLSFPSNLRMQNDKRQPLFCCVGKGSHSSRWASKTTTWRTEKARTVNLPLLTSLSLSGGVRQSYFRSLACPLVLAPNNGGRSSTIVT